MGSDSDWRVMSDASQALTDFGIPHEVEVVSAHRTVDKLVRYGREARARGLRVIVAGAGGAAHLPGMLASLTALPVVGVPVQLATLDGTNVVTKLHYAANQVEFNGQKMTVEQFVGFLTRLLLFTHDPRRPHDGSQP